MGRFDEAVENLFAEVLHVPASKITASLAMSEVEGWDSLKHMELIASLEQSFGIELTFDEIVQMRSVNAVKRVLKQRGVAN